MPTARAFLIVSRRREAHPASEHRAQSAASKSGIGDQRPHGGREEDDLRRIGAMGENGAFIDFSRNCILAARQRDSISNSVKFPNPKSRGSNPQSLNVFMQY